MVTVAKRPTGHKIIDQAITATIGEAYGGDALVTFPSHGLSTGDTVYITSDLEDYNGFWYVTISDTNTFKISEHATADFVEYFQDADIEYYQTQEHVWSSIFLPIIYKGTNDRWPVNTIDTVRTISSAADDNGFTEITLSGTLKTGVRPLEFVKISGSSADGVWQIVEVVDSTTYVINLPYESGLAGATAQYYYNNYQVRVKVYAGLPAAHPWSHKKPWQEVAELSLTPDDNNEVMFSVADYLQGKVAIKNNPLLFSMPLNLDAFTGFYISTGESYDYSDGYALGTVESSFTIDEFEGFAIAGKLPFKNVYAGDYADYIYTSGSPALWLTNRERLLAVEGYYFDVSFIKNITGDFQIVISKTVGDYSITETVDYDDQGEGVYRIPITPDANYDSFCIQAYKAAVPGFVPAVMTPFLSWANEGTGDPPELVWAIVDTHIEVDTNGLGLSTSSDMWHTDYAFEAGQSYSFGYSVQGNGCEEFNIDIVDGSGNVLDSETITPSDTSMVSGTFTFVAPSGAAGISLWVFSPCSCGSEDPGFCVKQWLNFTNLTSGSGGEPALPITEEICIDMLEVCEVEGGFVADTSRRLTEDGGFRLLE